MAQKISTFDDWTDYFNKWQKEIGFDASQIKDYKFDSFYADPPHDEVEFGEFKGRKKWEKLLDVPTQEMRDALMHLIVYQGDTEFASTEQQRDLLQSAPPSTIVNFCCASCAKNSVTAGTCAMS